MKCLQCGSENSADAKFCRGCGNKFERIEPVATGSLVECSKCGHANEAGKKFCPKCGTSLVAASPIPATPPGPDDAAIQPQPAKPGINKVVVRGVVAAVLLVMAGDGGYWYYQKQEAEKVIAGPVNAATPQTNTTSSGSPMAAKQLLHRVLQRLAHGDMLPGHFVVRAPDIAENGAVVPFEVSFEQPVGRGDIIYVFVDDKYLAMTAKVLTSRGVSSLSSRVKMSGSGTIRVVNVSSNGMLQTQSKNVNVITPALLDDQTTGGGTPDFKMRAQIGGGMGDIKLLFNSPQSNADFIEKIVCRWMGEDALVMDFTPLVSKNPFVGVRVMGVSGGEFSATLRTNRGITNAGRAAFF